MLNKKIKRVLAMMLIFAMTINFAVNSDVKAEEAVISPPIIDRASYWDEAPIGQKYDVTFASGKTTVIIPVEITVNGGWYITIFNSSFEAEYSGIDIPDKNYESLTVSLYKDNECKEAVLASASDTLIKGIMSVAREARVEEGIYYIKYDLTRGEGEGADDEMTFSSYIAQISSENRALIEGKEYAIYQDDSTGRHCYKIVVDEDGYLTFYAESFWNVRNVLKMQLLDSDGNSITKESSEVGYVATETDYVDCNGGIYKAYLLKKGTYFIQLSSNCGLCYLMYNNSPTTDTSGVSKKSAKKLTLGTGVSSVITLNDKKTKVDWYNFTYKTSKKPTIVFNGISPTSNNVLATPYGSSTGYANLEIVNSNGKTVYQIKHLSLSKKTILRNVGKKLKKETYYIKITKQVMESYGDYKLTVK